MLLVVSMVVSFFSLSFCLLSFSFFYIFVLYFYSGACVTMCSVIETWPSTLLSSLVYILTTPCTKPATLTFSIFLNTPWTLQAQDVLFLTSNFVWTTISHILHMAGSSVSSRSRTCADMTRLPEHPI